MELDRQTIEKRDFPISRRGYDADAVDAHLSTIASSVEDLRRSQRAAQQQQPPPKAGESLATAAAMQVQAIVEAAESTAADIRRQAEEEAERTKRDASDAANQTRDEAVGRAQAHVEGVSRSSAVMLQRVAAMESELGALIQSLRTGTDRLNADLALLATNMGDLYDAAGAPPAKSAEPAPVADRPALAVVEAPASTPDASAWSPSGGGSTAPSASFVAGALAQSPQGSSFSDAAAPPVGVEQPSASGYTQQPSASGYTQQSLAADGQAGAGAGGSPDVAGARMIALNMALNGQPREEADRYLADNFDIPNRQALIDEVYSALDG